jgi:hypothetical protein
LISEFVVFLLFRCVFMIKVGILVVDFMMIFVLVVLFGKK